MFAVDGQRASRAARLRQRVGEIVFHGEALLGEADRRRDQVGERELARAVFFVRQREAGDGAGHADGKA